MTKINFTANTFLSLGKLFSACLWCMVVVSLWLVTGCGGGNIAPSSFPSGNRDGDDETTPAVATPQPGNPSTTTPPPVTANPAVPAPPSTETKPVVETPMVVEKKPYVPTPELLQYQEKYALDRHGTKAYLINEKQGIVAYDFSTGGLNLIFPEGQETFTALGLSADGLTLSAITYDGKLYAWPVGNGAGYDDFEYARQQQLSLLPRSQTYTAGVTQLHLSANGAEVVAADISGQISKWDISEFVPRTFAAHPGGVTAVAINPQGNMLVSAGKENQLKLWSLPDFKLQGTLEGYTSEVTSIDFDTAGKFVNTAHAGGLITVWDLQSKQVFREIQAHRGNLASLEFIRDVNQLGSVGVDGYQRHWLFPPSTGKKLGRVQAGTEQLLLTPDQKQYIAWGTTSDIQFYDLLTGKPGKKITLPEGTPTAISLLKNGSNCVIANDKGTVFQYELGECQLLLQQSFKDPTFTKLLAKDTANFYLVGSNKIKEVNKGLLVENVFSLDSLSPALKQSLQTLGALHGKKHVSAIHYPIELIAGENSAKAYDASVNKVLFDKEFEVPIKLLAISIDGGHCCFLLNKTLKVFSLGNQTEIYEIGQTPESIKKLLISNEGQKVYALAESGEIWVAGKDQGWNKLDQFTKVADIRLSGMPDKPETFCMHMTDNEIHVVQADNLNSLGKVTSKVPVEQAVYSPFSRLIWGIKSGKILSLWMVKGNEATEVEVTKNIDLQNLAESSDGKVILAWSADELLLLSNDQNHQLLRLGFPKKIVSASYDAGLGKLIVLHEAGYVTQLVVPKGAWNSWVNVNLEQANADPVNPRLAIAGSKGKIELRNFITGDQEKELITSYKELSHLNFSLDGTSILVCGDQKYLAKINLVSGGTIFRIPIAAAIKKIHRDLFKQNFLVVYQDGTVDSFDDEKGILLQSFSGNDLHVDQHFMKKEMYLCLLKSGNVETKPIDSLLGVTTDRGEVNHAATDRSGNVFKAYKSGGLVGYNSLGIELKQYEPPTIKCRQVAVSADRNYLAYAVDNPEQKTQIVVRNLFNGSQLQNVVCPAPVKKMMFSEDGTVLMVLDEQDQLFIIQPLIPGFLEHIALSLKVSDLKILPDNRTVVLGLHDGNITTRKIRLLSACQPHTGVITDVLLTPRGNIVSAGIDKNLILSTGKSGQLLQRFDTQQETMLSLEYFEAEQRLSAISDKSQVLGWEVKEDAVAFEQAKSVAGFKLPMPPLAMTQISNTNLVLMITADQQPRLFDRLTGQEVAAFAGNAARLRIPQASYKLNLITAYRDGGGIIAWPFDRTPFIKSINTAPTFQLTPQIPVGTPVAPGIVLGQETFLANPNTASFIAAQAPAKSDLELLQDEIRIPHTDEELAQLRTKFLMNMSLKPMKNQIAEAKDLVIKGNLERQLATMEREQDTVLSSINTSQNHLRNISKATDPLEIFEQAHQLRKSIAGYIEANGGSSQSGGATLGGLNPSTPVFSFGVDPSLTATTPRPLKLQFNTRELHLQLAREAFESAPGVLSPGFLHVYDPFTGIKVRKWGNLKLTSLTGINNLPGRQLTLTSPLNQQFNILASTSEFNPEIITYALRYDDVKGTSYAIHAKAGKPNLEATVLEVHMNSPTKEEVVSWKATDAIALAFSPANNHRKIAFAVRERGVHKLIVADRDTLSAKSAVVLEEQSHSTSIFTPGNTPGIVYLQFSPDDKFLISYGLYGDQTYQLKYWALGWEQDQLVAVKATPQISPEPILNMEVPNPVVFMQNPYTKYELRGTPTNLRAIHFLPNRLIVSDIDTKYQKPPSKGATTGTDNSPTQTRIEGTIVTSKQLFETPYAKTTVQTPIVCSEDGRWLAFIDSIGKIHILTTVISAEKFLVSTRNEFTSNLDLRYINHAEVPASSSPIVGMTFAQKLPGTGMIPYLITASLDGKVKVWSMFEHEERLFREIVNLKK